MKRRYSMQARAQAVEDRRARILEAAHAQLVHGNLDEFTLEAVANRAEVSLKTVLRQFNSRDALLLATATARRAREEQLREVAPGDVAGLVKVLVTRYEQLVDLVPRMYAVEDSLEAFAAVRKAAVTSHRDWLATVFAAWLPSAGPLRKRRLLALYGATELSVWWIWRRQLGAGRATAAAAMRENLDALLGAWSQEAS